MRKAAPAVPFPPGRLRSCTRKCSAAPAWHFARLYGAAECGCTLRTIRVDDFEYNLQLIQGRDDELSQYDETVSELQSLVRERDVQVSEAKIGAADQEDEVRRLQASLKQLEGRLQQAALDAEAQAKGLQWTGEDALRRQQEGFERTRYELERALEAKDEELRAQRGDSAAVRAHPPQLSLPIYPSHRGAHRVPLPTHTPGGGVDAPVSCASGVGRRRSTRCCVRATLRTTRCGRSGRFRFEGSHAALQL
eukprot:COSAG01_NODE_7809_length_3047_cov_1.815807_3_plen_250_part_00